MRIAITGASGFVGQQLVPRLVAQGASILLVGRDPEKLRAIFPDCPAVGYENLTTAAAGFDLVLHLAVINNDQTANWAEIELANVELALNVCRDARYANIKTFTFISSLRALDESDSSDYARSKRLAVERLNDVDGINKIALYLPAVVGDSFSGRLAVLRHTPTFVRGLALLALRSLKPTVHIDRVMDALISLRPTGTKGVQAHVITDGQGDNPVFSKTKRLLDLGFSLAIIVLLWWAMLIIWAVVRLQSPGPGIFRQQRVGQYERVFTCLKFRTMYLSAPNAGTHEVPADAVTPFGHLLRRTKLDELPQVFNILRNDMSLVGPRPCLPIQSDMITARRSQGVFAIKPGITGLAQIRGIDMSDPVGLATCDREYLQLQSLLLDLKIVIKTARGAGSGDNVRTQEPASN